MTHRVLPLAGRRAAALALFGALAALVAGVLLWPRERPAEARGPAVRALLVDASASVSRRRPDRLRSVRARLGAEARAAREAGEEVLVAVFAEDVVLALGPAPSDELERALAGEGRLPLDPSAAGGRDGESRLADALALAREAVLAPDRRTGRVVVLGDGTYTGRDPARWLAALRAGGVAITHAAPGPAALPDAALLAAELPERVEAGAPLGLTLRYRVARGSPEPDGLALAAEVRLRDGAGAVIGTVRAALPLPPPGTVRGASVTAAVVGLGAAPSGRASCEVALVLTDARGRRVDPVPQNDAGGAATIGGAARGVGVLAGPGGEAAAAVLVSAIDDGLPGLTAARLGSGALAAGDGLQGLDALVLVDPSPDELPAALLGSYLRGGGGVLALLGWGALEGLAGEPEADLRSLLPLTPAPGPAGERDVILLVDGSGSMEGAPIEAVRRAAAELVTAAPAGDEVRLRFFTARLERGSTLLKRSGETAVSRAGALERALGARVPRGSTQIVESLEQLAGEREAAGREALVLLLTDGRESDELLDAERRAEAVRLRLAAARARLSVVAAGPRAELALLELLTGPDAAPVRAEELDDLDEIFRREVNRERVREGEPLGLRARAPGGLDDPAAALLGGPPPPARRILRAELSPGADALWTDDEGAPVLAAWRVGRGRAAALATHPGADWAPALPGGLAALGPLLRELARGGAAPAPRAAIAGSRVVVEGVVIEGASTGGEGDALPGLVRGRVIGADGRELGELLLAADPTAPRTRLAAPLPPWLADGPPGELLVVALEGGPAAALSRLTAPEWREPPLFVPAPPALPAGESEPDRPHPRAPHPFGPLWLGLGLLLLLAAGLLRARGQGQPAAGR